MITTENYFETTTGIDFESLPEALRSGDKLTRGAAQNNWSAYNSNDNIKRVVDAYLQKLGEWIEKKPSHERKSRIKSGTTPKTEKQPVEKDQTPKEVKAVEKVTPEITFIKRYVGLHGKTRDRRQILSFVNSLQRAIVEKRIRKTSPNAVEIENIQEQLISCLDVMGESILIKIDEKTLEAYSAIAGSEKAMLSLALIKQFIGLHGKRGVKEKAEALSNRIAKALKDEKITDTDPHIHELKVVSKSLQEYLEGKTAVADISAATLNGLIGIAEAGSKKKVRQKTNRMKNRKQYL